MICKKYNLFWIHISLKLTITHRDRKKIRLLKHLMKSKNDLHKLNNRLCFWTVSYTHLTAKKALRFTGHTALAVENAFIRRFDAGHADNRHWQLQLKRTQDQNGGFHTKMHFVRTDVPQLQKSRGVIHKAVSFRHRISGDIPSLTKHLQSQQPKTKKAIVAKAAAQGAWADVKLTAKAGINTALAAETTALTIKDIGWCEVKRKIAYKYQRDVSNVDDANHGLLASGKIVKDAVVGFQRFQRQKVTLKQERQRLSLIHI